MLVFVAAVVLMLIGRSRGPVAETREVVQSKADYRIKEVHLQEEDKGARWQLDAEYGEIFEGQGRTVMKKITVKINARGRDWTVTGDEGEMQQATKDVQLRGNVVVMSSDGLRMETERLNWTAAEKRAWTDQPVTLRQNRGVVVRGQGFDSRFEEESAIVKGRVRATILPEAMTAAKTP